MAKRIRIDDAVIDITPGTSIKDVVPQNTQQVVARSGNVSSVIPASKFGTDASKFDGMVLNQNNIDMGGGARQRYLDVEVSWIAQKFLKEFPGPPERAIVVSDNYQYIMLEAFPLPDYFEKAGYRYFYQPDHEDIFIVTCDYPENPPAGVHVRKQKNGKINPNLPLIEEALGGHLFGSTRGLPDSYQRHVEDMENEGWLWICFHYRNWRWNFNRRNPMEGDCLYKYVEGLYSALSGNHS